VEQKLNEIAEWLRPAILRPNLFQYDRPGKIDRRANSFLLYNNGTSDVRLDNLLMLAPGASLPMGGNNDRNIMHLQFNLLFDPARVVGTVVNSLILVENHLIDC